MINASTVKDIPRPAATQNPCTVCAPRGACLAFRGVEGALPFLHGGQGCATYIRRFVIGHYREPLDVACSNFNEQAAIFGGGAILRQGVSNVTQATPADTRWHRHHLFIRDHR